MLRSSFQIGCSVLALALLAFGCGGSEPAPQTPAPEPAPPPAATSAPAAEAPAPAAADEAWEGESEAKNGGNAGSAAAGAETRTSDVIAKVIKDNRKPFRACFEKTAKELPDVEGTMTLHFVLDPDGTVKSAELNQERSTIKAPSIVDCSIDELKKLHFPKSSRGMESVINYPFDFKR